MNWKFLTEISQLEVVRQASENRDVLIFKHSTTCSISQLAKLRLEDQWEENIIPDVFYLDVKRDRNVSSHIADSFGVHHESPQVLIIRKGECIYDASHFDISVEEIKETLEYHGHR
ncbi:MAG: bacillithiol system redox-active protein YtxJ [Saprospiraceae bacterium]|nr:bacillithiol system redox-active protein YtxJ [Saprospiraceae bacterium]MBK8854841.1 bacillithiol system redox-active protein YtxJ [Saprospiraceae bacterium]